MRLWAGAAGSVALLLYACGGDESSQSAASTSASSSDGATGGTTSNGGAGGGTTTSTAVGGAGGTPGSLWVTLNDPNDSDYGHQLLIPPGFGEGELTMELWIRPDETFPVGPVSGGSEARTNWSDVDNQPYSAGDWWYSGNFLLDGHNNSSFGNGTFSLQFYGGGRVRWLFGDGGSAGLGGHWSVGAYPASSTPSLLDGAWHHLTLVRRWSGASDATLELWIDGTLSASEVSDVRTDMRQWFDGWSGFPGAQEGWFWGAEKQAAVGVLSQYEDYKGHMAELRFWSLAKSSTQIQSDWAAAVQGDEPGLVGWYPMNEGSGTSACDVLDASRCIELHNMLPGHWAVDGPPLAP